MASSRGTIGQARFRRAAGASQEVDSALANCAKTTKNGGECRSLSRSNTSAARDLHGAASLVWSHVSSVTGCVPPRAVRRASAVGEQQHCVFFFRGLLSELLAALSAHGRPGFLLGVSGAGGRLLKERPWRGFSAVHHTTIRHGACCHGLNVPFVILPNNNLFGCFG